MWYDTAGCFNPNNFRYNLGLKGEINKVDMGPVQNSGAWYRGVQTLDTADGPPVGAPDQTVTAVADSYPRNSNNDVDWGMSIQQNDG